MYLSHFILFYLLFYFILCVWMFYLYLCLCTACVCRTYRGQKKALDLLVLELQMVVSHPIGSGSWSYVLWKNNQYSYSLSYLSRPSICIHSFILLMAKIEETSPQWERTFPSFYPGVLYICEFLCCFNFDWEFIIEYCKVRNFCVRLDDLCFRKFSVI